MRPLLLTFTLLCLSTPMAQAKAPPQGPRVVLVVSGLSLQLPPGDYPGLKYGAIDAPGGGVQDYIETKDTRITVSIEQRLVCLETITKLGGKNLSKYGDLHVAHPDKGSKGPMHTCTEYKGYPLWLRQTTTHKGANKGGTDRLTNAIGKAMRERVAASKKVPAPYRPALDESVPWRVYRTLKERGYWVTDGGKQVLRSMGVVVPLPKAKNLAWTHTSTTMRSGKVTYGADIIKRFERSGTTWTMTTPYIVSAEFGLDCPRGWVLKVDGAGVWVAKVDEKSANVELCLTTQQAAIRVWVGNRKGARHDKAWLQAFAKQHVWLLGALEKAVSKGIKSAHRLADVTRIGAGYRPFLNLPLGTLRYPDDGFVWHLVGDRLQALVPAAMQLDVRIGLPASCKEFLAPTSDKELRRPKATPKGKPPKGWKGGASYLSAATGKLVHPLCTAVNGKAMGALVSSKAGLPNFREVAPMLTQLRGLLE